MPRRTFPPEALTPQEVGMLMDAYEGPDGLASATGPSSLCCTEPAPASRKRWRCGPRTWSSRAGRSACCGARAGSHGPWESTQAARR
jgi:hypothetical protein